MAVVNRNYEQLSLFDDDTQGEDKNEPLALLTWFLLTYAFRDKVFCELSLPAAMASGQVQSWSKRILLAPIERDAQFVLSPADDEPDINIDLTRKAN